MKNKKTTKRKTTKRENKTMSGQIYTYEAHFTWKWHKTCDIYAIPDRPTVENGLQSDFKTAFLSSFAAQLSQTGHWYKMDDVKTTISSYSTGYTLPSPILPYFNIDVQGETVIYFETDIADATAHNSPGLWDTVQQLIQSVIKYLAANPAIVVIILVGGVLTILYMSLINTTTKAVQDVGKTLQDVGSNIGAAVIVLGVLTVSALGIYALFFTKGGERVTSKGLEFGEKATRKGYQTARRGYHAVRERLH